MTGGQLIQIVMKNGRIAPSVLSIGFVIKYVHTSYILHPTSYLTNGLIILITAIMPMMIGRM